MKKILLVVTAALVVLLVLTGCAAGMNNSSSYSGGKEYYGEAAAPEAPAMEAPTAAEEYYDDGYAEPQEAGESAGSGINYDSSILEPGVNRKIIYDGTIEARTKNYDEDLKTILTKLKELGGYQQDASESGTRPQSWQDTGRTAYMTLRVPNKNFDVFMNVLKGLGETVSTSVRGTDISTQYFDIETRLKTLRIREERLQELLKEAKGLEDIIELERELANVSYEIQINQTQLRDYDSLVDFSTVTVYLQEVNEVTSVTPSKQSLGERITSGFYAVVNALADFGEGLLIFLVAGSPILVPLAVGGVIAIVLVKRRKRRKEAQKNNNPGV